MRYVLYEPCDRCTMRYIDVAHCMRKMRNALHTLCATCAMFYIHNAQHTLCVTYTKRYMRYALHTICSTCAQYSTATCEAV